MDPEPPIGLLLSPGKPCSKAHAPGAAPSAERSATATPEDWSFTFQRDAAGTAAFVGRQGAAGCQSGNS